MDLIELRRKFGEGTDDEIVKAIWEVDRSVQTPDQARVWIWALVKRLLDTDRYSLAGTMLWGSDLWNPGPRAVRDLLRFVRSTQNMIVLGGAALGKAIP